MKKQGMDKEGLIPREEVIKLITEMSDKKDLKLENPKIRNVLFIGKSRTGKSTSVETLQGNYALLKSSSVASEKKSIKYVPIPFLNENEGYIFNLIDPFGVFEINNMGYRSSMEDDIANIIKDCKEHGISEIHAIILFSSYVAGVDNINSDIIALEKLINYFGAGTNMALCLPKAESLDSNQRDNIIAELEKQLEMGPLLDKIENNIFFMGAIDPGQGFPDQDSIKKLVQKVKNDRVIFFEFLSLCDNGRSLDNLPPQKDSIVS